jgi:UDP-galactopyranose mutase
MPDGVFSIGRAGSYDYAVDIDDCIVQALDIGSLLKTLY